MSNRNINSFSLTLMGTILLPSSSLLDEFSRAASVGFGIMAIMMIWVGWGIKESA